jgi:hypothetical protein
MVSLWVRGTLAKRIIDECTWCLMLHSIWQHHKKASLMDQISNACPDRKSPAVDVEADMVFRENIREGQGLYMHNLCWRHKIWECVYVCEHWNVSSFLTGESLWPPGGEEALRASGAWNLRGTLCWVQLFLGTPTRGLSLKKLAGDGKVRQGWMVLSTGNIALWGTQKDEAFQYLLCWCWP